MGSCLSGASSAPSPQTNNYDSSSGSSSRNYSRDSSAEMRLHRVPGRVFLNGSSPFASLFGRQGGKGVNQDAMLLWETFGNVEDSVFCGVFDGHGPHGHVVAKKVRDCFPLKIMEEWNSRRGDDGGNDDKTNNNNKDGVLKMMRELFLMASKFVDKELKLHYAMESFGSGTTAVTLFKKGQELVIANIGDSRAVLATLDSNGSLKPHQLTTDLKPDLPKELERIRICKGRVFALNNESDVARLWLPKVDSPGLAMSRAFGDFCLKNYGLISVPEVAYHRLNNQDQFIVLATDGIWDVLSNKEVVNIVASAPRASAAKQLVESAVQAWKTRLPTSKLDDCSAVCLFFHPNTNNTPNKNGGIESHDGKTKQRHQ
ncbi:probable protein phosphatase 2C 33 [Vicia villosa]|uniref:probable protein phosphatase 2C 33 n=1 Tax=Vicia villosa TaxID=3911 RepID=UPI00273CC3B0|nr:probable protein phosphatase 2C 33 [Vicia villosa]XP_058750242.1 probable protein phosphatase 2C 33 [Vicia villosa]